MKTGTISNMKKYVNKVGASLSWLAVLVTIVQGYPIFADMFKESYPTFELYYNGRDVGSGSSRDVVICVDDTTSAKSVSEVFPVFKNVTRMSAKDFAMIYTLTVNNISIEPRESEFNFSSEGNGTYVLKYNETMLPAHFSVKEPVRNIKVLSKNGELDMKVYATFDGVPEPYNFKAKTSFVYVSSEGKNYQKWKAACLRKAGRFARGNVADILYVSEKFDREYEFDRNIRYGRIMGAAPSYDEDGNIVREIYKISEPRFFKQIGILSYKVKELEGKNDSLFISIQNGLKADTALTANIYLENEKSGETNIIRKDIVLAGGKNELALSIDKSWNYVKCSLSNSNEKGLETDDRISAKNIAYVVLLAIVACFFICLGFYLWRRKTNDGNDHRVEQPKE